MRRSWALVVASFALVLSAGMRAQAESRTEWDETERRPAVDRPGEYRTTTTDTWMSLSPFLGILFPDGGLKVEPSPMLGLRFAFEPADVLEIAIQASSNFGKAWTNEQFGARVIHLDDKEHVEGQIEHFDAWIRLKNPELAFGPVQFWPGIGFGAFYLHDYEDDVEFGGAHAKAEFADTWLLHVSPDIRMDISVSERFRFGLGLALHFPVYVMKGDPVGDVEEKKFDFGHVIWEPSFFLSFLF